MSCHSAPDREITPEMIQVFVTASKSHNDETQKAATRLVQLLDDDRLSRQAFLDWYEHYQAAESQLLCVAMIVKIHDDPDFRARMEQFAQEANDGEDVELVDIDDISGLIEEAQKAK